MRFLFLPILFFAFASAHGQSESTVTIHTADVIGAVSPNVMGFNMVYCFEGDAPWQNGSGPIAQKMHDLGVGQFRYPGGTVVTRWHWEKPTGQGWSDEWDSAFEAAKNTPASSYMDIDEYLEMTKKLHIDPLVGINMGSGMKHHRVQEGVDEAIRLMKHCLSKGAKVKYYYLDNEPYQPDANYTFKPEEYADMVNLYVPAMKKIDPDIKIIVNTQPRADLYIKPLLAKAGKNIDFVDVHMYWKWRNATFANWIAEPLMTHQGKGTYQQQKQIWEQVFAEAGYPNIRLVILEWNIGPSGKNNIPPTETQAALMIGEQFTQYIKSGLFMSCFWPLSLPGNRGDNFRPVFRNEAGGYTPNRAYSMFTLYTDILGQQQVTNEVSGERLITLSVKSNDGKTLWVYLINKNQEASTLDLILPGVNAKATGLTGFDSDGKTIDKQNAGLVPTEAAQPQTARPQAAHYKVTLPKNALVKLTFTIA